MSSAIESGLVIESFDPPGHLGTKQPLAPPDRT
jgi:hypothetical protein